MSELEQLSTQALTIPEQARAIKITDGDSYQRAGALLVSVKGLRKQINAAFAPMKAAAVAAHKAVLEQEKKADAPLIEAENIIKPAMAAYDTEQERIRRDEERKAQEAARMAQESAQLAEAIQAEASGERAVADEIMAAPVVVAPVVVARTVPKVAGVSFVERWTYRIVNKEMIPRDYLMPDETRIGQVARAMKGAARIPGVEVFSVKGTSARG